MLAGVVQDADGWGANAKTTNGTPHAVALLPRTLFTSALILFLVALQVLPASAWVFPEHRDIVVNAVGQLDSDHQARLQSLWTEARTGPASVAQRLCAAPTNDAQVSHPTCVDLSAFAAISGDHSCSAADMLSTALDAPWALGVEQVAARLKAQLAAANLDKHPARQRSDRTNAVRNSDLALERTDPDYATRASNNNAHFLLARKNIAMTPEQYVRMALATSSEVNALGTYVWYNLRALDRARSVARNAVPAEQRAEKRRPRRARRRGLRVALPRGQLRRRPHRRKLGRHHPAQRHPRLLQRARPRPHHLERRPLRR